MIISIHLMEIVWWSIYSWSLMVLNNAQLVTTINNYYMEIIITINALYPFFIFHWLRVDYGSWSAQSVDYGIYMDTVNLLLLTEDF